MTRYLWYLIQPETLLVLLLLGAVVLGLLGFARVSRGLSILVLLLVLAIGFYPTENLVLRPLERMYRAEPEVADPAGIIVLGGAEETYVSNHWKVPNVNQRAERFLSAVTLARAFPDVPVLFTGGHGARPKARVEDELPFVILRDAGIAEDRLIMEVKSQNTAQNAALSLALVPADAEGPWLLVTSANHMHRALISFCAAGWTNLVPWPVDYRTGGGRLRWRLAQNLQHLNIGMHEWAGTVVYLWTGRGVLPQEAPGCLSPDYAPGADPR